MIVENNELISEIKNIGIDVQVVIHKKTILVVILKKLNQNLKMVLAAVGFEPAPPRRLVTARPRYLLNV